MKHPFTSDRKYKFGALFILVFIGAAYFYAHHDGTSYWVAHAFLIVFSLVVIGGYLYFKLKR